MGIQTTHNPILNFQDTFSFQIKHMNQTRMSSFIPVWWWSHWWGGGCVHLGCSVARHSPSAWAGPVVSPCAGALVIAPLHQAGTGHRKSLQTQRLLPLEPLPGPHVLKTEFRKHYGINSGFKVTLLLTKTLKFHRKKKI